MDIYLITAVNSYRILFLNGLILRWAAKLSLFNTVVLCLIQNCYKIQIYLFNCGTVSFRIQIKGYLFNCGAVNSYIYLFNCEAESFCTHAEIIKLLKNTKLTKNTKSKTDNKISIHFLYKITNLHCDKTKYTNLHCCHQHMKMSKPLYV